MYSTKRGLVIAFVIAAVTLIAATSAQAVQITQHVTYRDPTTGELEHAEYTVDVPPTDTDQDGTADTSDGCPSTVGPTSNGGCPIPAPAPTTSATTTSSTTTTSSGGYAIPAYIVQCESGGNPQAVNSSSRAGGLYQIMPSTWQLYGGTGAPQDASVAEQSAIASQIWADSGASAWSCG